MTLARRNENYVCAVVALAHIETPNANKAKSARFIATVLAERDPWVVTGVQA